ncbi:MAG TPA: hypothetical protein VFO83_09870 [Aggregicoccus sp.]|nr:hypothetical protein [Aggregicoccus sp.]
MRKLLPGLGRATATLLVVLWAVQPVALWAHAGEHTHRYCAAHRTFEEGQPRGGDDSIGTPPAARAGLREAPAPASEASGPRSHEACGLPSCGPREPALLGDLGSLRERATVTRPPSPLPAVAPAPPLSVLDTAPKASPPARA